MLQGMSSAGQKRSPPNELERQVSLYNISMSKHAAPIRRSALLAESQAQLLMLMGHTRLAGLTISRGGGKAAESITTGQHHHL